jgi:hypothetical protein
VVLEVSLGYVALALMYFFTLQVCDFTGGVVQGKPRVYGSSTGELVFLGSMRKPRVVALSYKVGKNCKVLLIVCVEYC